MTIDLGAGIAVGADMGHDTFLSIENAQGSGFGDLLAGSTEANIMIGYDGDDNFVNLAGNDLIDGGNGADSAIWSGFRKVYSYVLAASGDDTVSGAEGSFTLRNVEHLRFIDGTFVADVHDPAAQVSRLYGATLGRAPDAGGLSGWTDGLKGGMSLQQVVDGFTGSAEFQGKYGALDNTGFVTLLYNNVLHRAADSEGLNSWVRALEGGASRGDIVLGFSESPENIELTRSSIEQGLWLPDKEAAQVARLYDATLDRLPDAFGLGGWISALENGMTLTQVAQGFTDSAEFQQKYGTLDNVGFVSQLYRNVLDREPDAGGLNAWVGELEGGKSRADVLVGFSESLEHQVKLASVIDDGIWFA
jgi:hypothetical protein